MAKKWIIYEMRPVLVSEAGSLFPVFSCGPTGEGQISGWAPPLRLVQMGNYHPCLVFHAALQPRVPLPPSVLAGLEKSGSLPGLPLKTCPSKRVLCRDWVSITPPLPCPRGHPPPQAVTEARSHSIGSKAAHPECMHKPPASLVSQENCLLEETQASPFSFSSASQFHSWSEAGTTAQLGH